LPVIYIFGRFVSAVSFRSFRFGRFVSVVSFRSFRWFRWFRPFRFGRFVSTFRLLVHAYRMDLVYCLAQRCKHLFSTTITLPDFTRINLYTELWVRGCRAESKLVKTALNTAITVKLLKSKVTYMRIYAKSVTLGI
jgi:hypothetical protein